MFTEAGELISFLAAIGTIHKLIETAGGAKPITYGQLETTINAANILNSISGLHFWIEYKSL
jgi:poly(3-hydroxybutyrate) depolymerase